MDKLLEKQRPKVGIAVYILNKNYQVLFTLRKSVVGAGRWCPPGGHLEYGEELLDCVKREVAEEVNLTIDKAELWAVNNNIMVDPPRHYVNLDFVATKWIGHELNRELEKCEKIEWFSLNNLPKPLLEPTENFFKQNPFCLCQSGKRFNVCHGKI